jgi:5-methylcytosine-specific restriction endonuclease McrA
MRTPNTQCLLCKKPLYRRPYEMAKTRYAACMSCRSDAQKAAGITDNQKAGLSLGREKGTNHRSGYKHREESKIKVAAANKKFWENNPERLLERGAKTRGNKHYRWKGGISKLNVSIRQMTENRKWMDAVKARDGKCAECDATENLESHHRIPLAGLIASLGIQNRDDARRYAAILWDLDNGVTLCQQHHYKQHGRSRNENPSKHVSTAA